MTQITILKLSLVEVFKAVSVIQYLIFGFYLLFIICYLVL